MGETLKKGPFIYALVCANDEDVSVSANVSASVTESVRVRGWMSKVTDVIYRRRPFRVSDVVG